MKFDLYRLQLTGSNTGTRTFVETIEAADEDEARLAAVKKHTSTSTADYEYFRTFYRLFDHGTVVQTEGVKFGRDLVEKMLSLESEGMSDAERQAYKNN